MARTIRLSLGAPVALQGTERGIWVADRDSRSLTCFDADSASQISRVDLPEPPVSLAAGDGFIAAALASGSMIAFDTANAKELWRNAAGAGEVQLKSSAGLVWAAEKNGAALLSFDRSGSVNRVFAEGWQTFAPAEDSMYWLSREGVLVGSGLTGQDSHTEPLRSVASTGGLVACANALWLSVSKGLLLIDQRTLQPRTTLDAPEGPVPHLICEDGKLAGGLNGVFVLNPMSDARVHPLPVEPRSALRGIAATPSRLWALESAEPVVHIADFV